MCESVWFWLVSVKHPQVRGIAVVCLNDAALRVLHSFSVSELSAEPPFLLSVRGPHSHNGQQQQTARQLRVKTAGPVCQGVVCFWCALTLTWLWSSAFLLYHCQPQSNVIKVKIVGGSRCNFFICTWKKSQWKFQKTQTWKYFYKLMWRKICFFK